MILIRGYALNYLLRLVDCYISTHNYLVLWYSNLLMYYSCYDYTHRCVVVADLKEKHGHIYMFMVIDSRWLLISSIRSRVCSLIEHICVIYQEIRFTVLIRITWLIESVIRRLGRSVFIHRVQASRRQCEVRSSQIVSQTQKPNSYIHVGWTSTMVFSK